MDENSKNNEDNDNKLRRIKKTKTFGNELLNKNSIILDKRENSVNYSKRYNSSKRLIDTSSQNSISKSFKKDSPENGDIKGNKFISNSKIKLDDMKLKIANNKIKNYINNLIGGSINNVNTEREFTSGLSASPQHKRVESLRKNENRRNSKFGNRLSFPSMDLKNNKNNYMLTVVQEDLNNKNFLSGFNVNSNFNNSNLNIEKNFNNNVNGPSNRNIYKSNHGKLNNIIGEINVSNEFNQNSDEQNNWKKKSFTSKVNDENESYNRRSFLQLDGNHNNMPKNNKVMITIDNKRPDPQADFKLSIQSNLIEKPITSNLLLLNENLNFKNNENNINNKGFDFLNQLDENANLIKLKNQSTLNSVERNFLEAENESNLRNNYDKKNYFLGLHSNQKRSNINLISKKSEVEIKRNSSIGSNHGKSSKLLGCDLAAKNKLISGIRNESHSNNNFLLNKSLTNSNIVNVNKNRDFSFESENLDREILNIHLKYSNNNFEEVIFKNKKKKRSRKSAALVKEEQSKNFLIKLNQMNSLNNVISSNNQLISLNTNVNANSKNEQIAIIEPNNYTNNLDSQSNLILASDNFQKKENSDSNRKLLYTQGNLIGNKNMFYPLINSNLNSKNEESNDKIKPISKLNQPIQINIPSNLNLNNKNYSRNFDFDINNVRKGFKKGNFLDLENDEIEMRNSSENSSQDERSIKIFHNIYDSFSGEEWDEAKAHKPDYILRPDCFFKEIMDIISTLFVFYTIIFSPYQMAFEKDGDIPDFSLLYFDIFIDFFFVLDFLLNFITAYRDEKDDLIYSLKKILSNYLKTWFIFDFISCVPFTFINYLLWQSEAEETSSRSILMDRSNNIGVSKLQRFAKIAKFYRLLKWSKILRFLKITKSDNKAKSIFENIDGLKSSINRFLKFLIIFIFLIHFATCIWIFVANMNISNGDPINWITYYNLIDQSNTQIYITSFYFILVTVFSIGYGDITPKSFTEKLMSLVLLTVGCLIFSYALSSLSNIFSQIDKKKEIYNKKESILNEIKLEYRLDQVLERKIKNSLKHDLNSWNEDRLKLLDSLPSILKNQLYLKMYEDKIRNLIFFDNQSYEFITLTIGYLKSVKFSKNDYIISIGEIIYEMYLTITGLIGVELGTKYQKHEICIIQKNFHFGDILMYTNQQSKLSYKVKTIHSELFILSKINFAQIKLAFDKPTSKLLEQSYEFFMKIERTRILAIRYFEKNGSFDEFRTFLKKYVNKKNMQFKHQYHGMGYDSSEISVDQQLQSNFYDSRSQENADSVSDIFTINSRKTNMSEIIYDQDRNEDSRDSTSKISKLTNNVKVLKDNLSVKKNFPSSPNKISYKKNNHNDKLSKFDINNSLMSDAAIEDKINIKKSANKIFKSNKDYFNNHDSFKENADQNSKEIKEKYTTILTKKKTFFLLKKEPLEQINEDETVFLKKSKTAKYLKNKPDDANMSTKIKKLVTKEKNKDCKLKNKKFFDASDQDTTKKNNITLNYKGFNINSMIFTPEEKKKLKFRYETLNLDISSSSSFFNSEKDEEKHKFVNQATPLKKCKTTRFDQNNYRKGYKDKELLTTNENTLMKKRTMINSNYMNSSHKKDLSKLKISSESKTEKEIMIKNQLIRALTSTSKKDYNEDINNFYTFNYEKNEEPIKLKNFDKQFKKLSSINKENKRSKFKNATRNNTIKEKNSVKYSDDFSKNSDYFEFKKGSLDIMEDKETLINNAFSDFKNKENINNNIKSDISLLNSNNSKNIIYINNLNINYSNQNANPIERLNNPGHFNLNDNNLIITNNDTQISKLDRMSLEQRFSINNINRIINSNNFVNQEIQEQKEFNTKEQSDLKDYKILNNLSNKNTNNLQKEIKNNDITKPNNPLEDNSLKPINDKIIHDSSKTESKQTSNNFKYQENFINKESDNNKNKNKKSKDFNNKDYNSDNVNIIKNSDYSNSDIRFKSVKMNLSPKKINKSEFLSESESKARRSKRPSVRISSSSNKKENNKSHFKDKFNEEANKHKSNSVCKNLNNIITNLIDSPNMRNTDYYETDTKYFNRIEKKNKNNTAAGKKSKTTKINSKNYPKSSKTKSIFDSNRGINFYSGFNVPMDNSASNNNNNKINQSNKYNTLLRNLKTSSNQNSYHLNSTVSKPNKSIPNDKITSDTNIYKNKTFKQYKTVFDGRPSLTVKRSANEVNYKSFFNQNLINNNFPISNNSNSVSQLKFLKKKSFLEFPSNLKEKGEHDFLKILSNKITYDAFLYKNKELLQNCIKDFLDDIQGESQFKHIMNRLNNLELLVKEYVKNSNAIVTNRKKNSKKITERL